jgi:hypothetical protein
MPGHSYWGFYLRQANHHVLLPNLYSHRRTWSLQDCMAKPNGTTKKYIHTNSAELKSVKTFLAPHLSHQVTGCRSGKTFADQARAPAKSGRCKRNMLANYNQIAPTFVGRPS